jgi:hypothetical protein
MRRFSLGWRSVFVAAAVASLILLPISQAFSDERGEALGQKRTGGIEMAQRGEEAPGFVPTYSRANYQWPYAEGPYYGDESKALGGADRLVRTSVGVFDLTKGQPRFPQELKAQNKLDKGPQYFIVQLDPASRDSGSFGRLKAELNGSDGKIVRSMPSSAMIVLLNSAGKAKIESNPDVIAVEPYHAAFKLDPTIGRVPLPDPMKAVSEVYSLEIRVFPGEDSGAVAREIKKLGGSVTATYPDTVIAEIHRSKLGDVAAIEPVEAVFEALPNQLWGEETTTTLQTGRYNAGATPYHDAGIDGGGGGLAAAQVLMILDSGIQLDAGDLSNTKVSAGVAGVGHRKVRFYGTTDVFGGLGDLTGCDAGPSGGYSHGHVVAATALGNATAVPGSYGTGWQLEDNNGNLWKIDGVAKGAKLVAYDAQQTPAATSCADPLLNTISPGDLYSGGATGSLGVAYTTHGARVFNFSWGSNANVYSAGAQDVDQFLQDKGDALVFVAAGNAGLDADNDGVPDAASIGQPATTKNGLCIGASRAANDQSEGGAEDEREFFSSIGPAAGVRIAPQLMSPGGEEANAQNMGLRSEYACRTNDNDQLDPVECDRVDQLEGTSFASPGAAGAALLVRDYFAQGGYPDGTTTDIGNAGDQIPNISGALVKAVLIASADYMTGDRPPSFSAMFPGGDGLTVVYRFNNEQGYGRIQLSNALPLQTWPESVSGLRVQDSVVAPVAGGIGLANTVDADGWPHEHHVQRLQPERRAAHRPRLVRRRGCGSRQQPEPRSPVAQRQDLPWQLLHGRRQPQRLSGCERGLPLDRRNDGHDQLEPVEHPGLHSRERDPVAVRQREPDRGHHALARSPRHRLEPGTELADRGRQLDGSRVEPRRRVEPEPDVRDRHLGRRLLAELGAPRSGRVHLQPDLDADDLRVLGGR